MGLVEIAVSFAAAILIGALTRGTWRTNLLLILSVLAVYWFQPTVRLRSFDFWFPSLTLALVTFVWFITSESNAWRPRQNWTALIILLVLPGMIDVTGRLFPEATLLKILPPQFSEYGVFILIAAAITIF